MGVQGLLPLLRRIAPESIQSIAVSAFSNLCPVVAIDGTLLLMRNFRSQYCRRQKITPIVVFDNPIPNEFKAQEHEKRRLTRANLLKDRDNILKRELIQNNLELVLLSQASPCTVSNSEMLLYSMDNLLEELSIEESYITIPSKQKDLESTQKLPDDQNPSSDLIDKKEKKKKLEKIDELYNQLMSVLSDFGPCSDVKAYLETVRPRIDLQDLRLCIRYLFGKLDLVSLRDYRLKTKAELEKYDRRLYSPTRQHFEELFELLKILNIPVTYAPVAVEAEAFASAIYKKNLAAVVATQDTDTLALGAPMVTNFLDNSELFYRFFTYLNPLRICNNLKISHRQFQTYCLMCGTDFSTRIPQIGPVRALELVQKHKDISAVLNDLSLSNKYNVPEDYEKKMHIALKRFTNLPSKNELFQFINANPKSFLQISDSYYLELESQALKLFNLESDYVQRNVHEYYF
ncbi:XP-G family nuclease [Schizosaccharomyces cryophilus OY26]|uniref:XP-G family nuclease n=1 Tax=Schizosaccharomyces cryophilus (strain OY26 / ATCC MYA-4695 / CBS 11777 / NBRC 106824 / NRRL Y48691) TaxID=653667 RepID=S9W2J4_SCHCR|nr:XP-G family nuclease [Schizosaccharomyces cryophilus OY26]EPY52649.1 XP-G family nuclease [Schizosaccharomyces cryophilus OY26]